MDTAKTAYDKIVAKAQKETTTTLLLSLHAMADRRTASIARGDSAETQALNMVISGTEQVLIDRFPELDAAIDVWCEECNDERSMAQFIIDWFLGEQVSA